MMLVKYLPQWFYIAGSVCFIVGTVIGMLRS
jgi:hypothetical protein